MLRFNISSGFYCWPGGKFLPLPRELDLVYFWDARNFSIYILTLLGAGRNFCFSFLCVLSRVAGGRVVVFIRKLGFRISLRAPRRRTTRAACFRLLFINIINSWGGAYPPLGLLFFHGATEALTSFEPLLLHKVSCNKFSEFSYKFISFLQNNNKISFYFIINKSWSDVNAKFCSHIDVLCIFQFLFGFIAKICWLLFIFCLFW